MAKDNKTNAMRILEKLNIPYTPHSYECDNFIDGVQIAEKLGEDCAMTFKTLVTVARSGKYFVFCLPVDKELDLKKCARAVSEKALTPIHVKDILAVTGYIRGGCSPVGMKKPYRTVIHKSAEALERMIVSGGRLGLQLELRPDDLIRACSGEYADVTTE